jgi:hypothetical protein
MNRGFSNDWKKGGESFQPATAGKCLENQMGFA